MDPESYSNVACNDYIVGSIISLKFDNGNLWSLPKVAEFKVVMSTHRVLFSEMLISLFVLIFMIEESVSVSKFNASAELHPGFRCSLLNSWYYLHVSKVVTSIVLLLFVL